MTVYAVSVGDRKFRVEVRESQLWIDGEPVVFELSSLNGNGLHLFRRAERSTEMYFKPANAVCGANVVSCADAVSGTNAGDAGDAQYEVVVNGRPLLARVDSRPPSRGKQPGCGQSPGCGQLSSHGIAETRAPMPGLIVEVVVVEGQDVRKGDVLLTQESMKMQMQLRAPVDGRVTSVRVKAGDQVEKGAALVAVEALQVEA